MYAKKHLTVTVLDRVWKHTLEIIRKDDKLLASALCDVEIGQCVWTFSDFTLVLLVKENSFIAEQLMDGGLEKVRRAVDQVIVGPVVVMIKDKTK